MPDIQDWALAHDSPEDGNATTVQSFLAIARKRFARATDAESKNRALALCDLRFKAGDQWDPSIKAKRLAEERPCLTINKLKTFVHQITNDQRQNRPGISIIPTGDKGNKQTAQMLTGLIRAIERLSDGDIAYDTAFDNAVSNGFGYWRIVTDYQDEDSFDQTIKILRVRNPFTVYLDPDRQMPDGSDAQWGFVTEMMPREEFKREFPDADPCSWDSFAIGDTYRGWYDEKALRIAEYFVVETKMRTLVRLANGHVGYKDELAKDILTQMKMDSAFILDQRESECKCVKWYKITGKEILEGGEEDEGQTKLEGRLIPGTKWIPIVECLGDEIDIEGNVIKSGIIRDAIDPQRMKNYWSHGCLKTPVPTPFGWKFLGDIHAGDKVFDENGSVCNVLGESPTFLFKDCYKITFQDGCEIVTSGEHLWQVEERGKRKTDGIPLTTKTVSTSELDHKRHFVKSALPLELPDSALPVHPYLLGHWLSDGDSASNRICPGDEDIEEVRSILKALGCDPGMARYGKDGHHGVFTAHGIRPQLRDLGLLRNKHIPQIYLRASREQRLDLLRGIMDSDGSIGKINKLCSFTTVTPALAEGFAELVASLGIRAGVLRRDRGALMMPQGTVSQTQPCWQFSFCAGPDDDLFKLKRKRAVQYDGRRCYSKRTKRHEIRSVERVQTVPVKCIGVDSKNNLFLWGKSMIPTHNSAMTERVALETKSPWIMAEGQIEGHEDEWRTANTVNRNVITYRMADLGGKMAPPPQRPGWMGPPAGVMAAEAQSEQDMMATTGVRFDATKSERIADESGTALKQLHSNQQLGAFHYLDNYARSLKQSAKICLAMAPCIFTKQMVLTIINEDDSHEQVMIDPNQQTDMEQVEYEGRNIKCYNLGYGKFTVDVSIGPNYQTRMQEASDSMMTFGKFFPTSAQFIGDLVAKNQPWPGSDEISKRLAMTLPPEMLAPEIPNMTPEQQALVMKQQQQIQAMQQQMQQMGAALQDKEADRAVETDKINKVFEASQTKSFLDFEAKMKSLMADERDTTLAHIREVMMAVKDSELATEKMDIDRTRANAQMLQALQPEPKANGGGE